MNADKKEPRTAIVTGASSGMGLMEDPMPAPSGKITVSRTNKISTLGENDAYL
jgi:hypothetical protein